jgi:hypothetical protein
MFYKTNIDITNDKQMFNFIANHFTYYTMNSWNRTRSIANNVKLYNLGLSGDWCTALNLLESDDYFTINTMIEDWEREHPGYSVGFNGRSGGYLVLYNRAGGSVIPDTLDYECYEDYKADMRDYYGSVKANRDELVEFVKLVRDFDKLCDELRGYVDGLSTLKFEVVEMEKAVEDFNYQYQDDLGYLGFEELSCTSDGRVDVSEIRQLDSLWEAFVKVASRPNSGYVILCGDDGFAYYEDR